MTVSLKLDKSYVDGRGRGFHPNGRASVFKDGAYRGYVERGCTHDSINSRFVSGWFAYCNNVDRNGVLDTNHRVNDWPFPTRREAVAELCEA